MFGRRAALLSLLGAGAAITGKPAQAQATQDTVETLRIGNPNLDAKAICVVFCAPSASISRQLFAELLPYLSASPSQVDETALAVLPWYQSDGELESISALVSSNPGSFPEKFADLLLGNGTLPVSSTLSEATIWRDELRATRTLADFFFPRPQNAPAVPPLIISGIPYWGVSSVNTLRQVITLRQG